MNLQAELHRLEDDGGPPAEEKTLLLRWECTAWAEFICDTPPCCVFYTEVNEAQLDAATEACELENLWAECPVCHRLFQADISAPVTVRSLPPDALVGLSAWSSP